MAIKALQNVKKTANAASGKFGSFTARPVAILRNGADDYDVTFSIGIDGVHYSKSLDPVSLSALQDAGVNLESSADLVSAIEYGVKASNDAEIRTAVIAKRVASDIKKGRDVPAKYVPAKKPGGLAEKLAEAKNKQEG